MEKNILQILEKNNRIIVPEFGAFIVKQRNPLTIIFNEFLQYNDGMLINYIAKYEDISRDDAKTQIDEFVAKVTEALKKDNECSLSGLGVLEKNSAGKISITSAIGAKTTKAPKTKQPPQKAPEKVSEKITESETLDIQEPEAKKPEIKIPAKEPAEIKTEPPKPKEEKPTVVDAISKDDTIEPPKPAEKPTPTPTPTIENKTASYEPLKPTSSKKKQNTWLWIIIVAVNVALVSYFVLTDQFKGLSYKDTTEEEIDFFEEDLSMPEKTDEQTLVPETDEPTESIEQEVYTETVSASQTNENKHFIVAGVFREEQNANNLVTELQKQGFDSKKFGMIGNLHAVSYGGYATKEEAIPALRKIQQTTNPEAWIRTIK